MKKLIAIILMAPAVITAACIVALAIIKALASNNPAVHVTLWLLAVAFMWIVGLIILLTGREP